MYYYEGETPSQDFSLASTQTCSTYSGCSSECSEMMRIKLLICVKMFTIILTLLGGAVLALCINVIKRYPPLEEPPPGLPRSTTLSNDEFFGDGLSYYQVKNLETGLCLDDNKMTDKWNFDAFKGQQMKMYLKKCDNTKKRLAQYFKFDEKKHTLGKDNYCLKQAPIVGAHKGGGKPFEWWLGPCIPNDKSNTIEHSKTLRQLYLPKSDSNYCLTAEPSGDGKLAFVRTCAKTMDKFQAWEFIGPLAIPN